MRILGHSFIYVSDTDYLDVFYNPDDPASGELYAYALNLPTGTLTIAKDGNNYNINGQFNGELEGENDEVIFTSPVTVNFTGEVPFFDKDAYQPLGGDVELGEVALSGRCDAASGGWSMAFYNCKLDEDGFIVGAGNLLNVELYTAPAETMVDDMLIGEFTVMDMFNEPDTSKWPGHYMNGVWYDFYGMYIAIGTALSTYDDFGNVVLTGLAKDGTVKFTKLDQDLFHADFNLVTVEGDKITGSWEGSISECVQGATAGVNEVIADDAPVQYFNLQGMPVQAPAKGSVVIRHQGAKAEKVIM